MYTLKIAGVVESMDFDCIVVVAESADFAAAVAEAENSILLKMRQLLQHLQYDLNFTSILSLI